jgi:hypothetical protein
MIGWVQGRQSIVDAVTNIIFQTGTDMPNVGFQISALTAAYIQAQVNPAYGSYWAFGILLVIGAFILVARGDRKPAGAAQEA